MTSKSKVAALAEKWADAESLDQIEEWAASGLTNSQIARNMGASTSAFNLLRARSSQVSEAVQRGRYEGSGDTPRRQPREWTAAETAFVSKFAGLVPLSKIAIDLSRDLLDVADECARIGADPRYLHRPLYWCPFCSSWRPSMRNGGEYAGMCEACVKRRQLERIEGRIAALLPRLPPESVETYAVTEAERGSTIDPRPRAPSTYGMDERAELAARIAYSTAIAEWEEKQLERQVKAAQKRKERIERRVKDYERSTER